MHGVRRLDAVVASGFVLGAAAEAAVRHHGTPGLLTFDVFGALALASLAVRRRRPLVPICVIAAAGVVGTTVTTLVWPHATDAAGVWILAMMVASYSVGAHRDGRLVVLGALLPLAVVMAADLTTRSGWSLISGIVFVTLFVGALPTAVGRMVRVRTRRLRLLRDQREQIMAAQREQAECAVMSERLRTVERLRPTLLGGLQQLAACAETTTDPGEVERSARRLLAHTREEVVTLSAPIEVAPAVAPPVADHLRTLRYDAQPWSVVAAGAIAVGLSVESSQVLVPSAAAALLLPASLVVGAPLVLAWWRPLASVSLAWLAAAAYSRVIAPLDGSLSETALAFAAAFAVAALSRRRAAVAGLGLCWFGQLVGVGTDDPVGDAGALLLCWLGGLAVNEASRLVEQTRANNRWLRQDSGSAARAVLAERFRLAREIHDALGHSLTVVALHAGAARRLAETDPDRVRDIMRTVASAARGGVASLALDEGSADEGSADGGSADEGSADLASLVERVRATGLDVDAELAHESLLDPGQRVIGFRIVQEALTNVLRHAPGSRARVSLSVRDHGVEIRVSNTAPTTPGSGPGTGRGLAGIRERVTAASGRVVWRPLEDGGFEVRAFLPTARAPVPAR